MPFALFLLGSHFLPFFCYSSLSLARSLTIYSLHFFFEESAEYPSILCSHRYKCVFKFGIWFSMAFVSKDSFFSCFFFILSSLSSSSSSYFLFSCCCCWWMEMWQYSNQIAADIDINDALNYVEFCHKDILMRIGK